jgi:PST family polysaccharide transporter
MEDIDINLVKQKSAKGIFVLAGRTFLLQSVAFFSTILLTIFLSPSVFGIFYIVSAVISFLSYFSDIGLAAALIQKKEALTDEDLATTFTIQQILVLTLTCILLGIAPIIGSFYGLDTSGVWLLRALAISFFLSSLKTIPSVLLERKLGFEKLVIPQIIETVSFYGIALLLAIKGWGLASFTYAVLVRAFLGLIAIYSIQPWKVRLSLSRATAKRLLTFGLPFQANSVLALLKDDLMTLFLGKILPFAQVGYIGWAKKWAEVPLRLIMDSVIRVTFPTFARLQHSKELLGHAIEKAMFGLALCIFPISVGLLFFVQPLVSLYPRYSKWEPALFSFTLFVGSSLFASFSTPLVNVLNAIGKVKVTLSLMVFWTVATWVLTVTFIRIFGFNGVALAILTLSTSIILVVFLVKKSVSFSFLSSIRYPLLGAGLQMLWYVGLRGSEPYNAVRLIFVAASGGILYLAVQWVFEKKEILSFLRLLKKPKGEI